MRKSHAFILASVAVAALLVGVATSASAAPSMSAKTSVASPYSAADVFKAVMFLQGPLGKTLASDTALAQTPDFSSDLAFVNEKSSLATTSKLVSQVAKAHPQFLSDFVKSVEGGNPTSVSQSSSQASSCMSKTPLAIAETNAQTTTYVPGQAGPDCGVVVVVGAFFVIAAAVFAAVGAVLLIDVAGGVNVAVANTKVKVHGSVVDGATVEQREAWVENVATKLAA